MAEAEDSCEPDELEADPSAQDRDTRHPDTERTLIVQAGKRDVRRRIADGLRDGKLPAASQPALEAAAYAQRLSVSSTSQDAPAATSTPTAYLYLRVSTREQARTGGGEEGYSIPAQREAGLDKARQLGAAVTGEYTDAGESAKTANRPELQRMLKDIRVHRPTYVIVHKIDRLARNREDDIAINLALKKAGVTLVSCTENVTDTPSGRFLYNIMADMAQFYSDNLAQEVLKGLVTKAKEGGTPHKAPLGYLHKREYVDGIMRSWVEADPLRAPLLAQCHVA